VRYTPDRNHVLLAGAVKRIQVALVEHLGGEASFERVKNLKGWKVKGGSGGGVRDKGEGGRRGTVGVGGVRAGAYGKGWPWTP
jgi:hypothetical protein